MSSVHLFAESKPTISFLFRRGCGGAFGTDPLVDPLSSSITPDGRVPNLKKGQIVTMNVTTPRTITGRGGTSELNLNYVCIMDFCEGIFVFRMFLHVKTNLNCPVYISVRKFCSICALENLLSDVVFPCFRSCIFFIYLVEDLVDVFRCI